MCAASLIGLPKALARLNESRPPGAQRLLRSVGLCVQYIGNVCYIVRRCRLGQSFSACRQKGRVNCESVKYETPEMRPVQTIDVFSSRWRDIFAVCPGRKQQRPQVIHVPKTFHRLPLHPSFFLLLLLFQCARKEQKAIWTLQSVSVTILQESSATIVCKQWLLLF